MTFYLSIKPFFLRFKSKINPSRPVAQWIQTWRKRLVRIHLYKKDILLCYLVYTLINSFPQHHINHAILYNQFYLPFQYDETLSIWYSRWFTCRLRFFSWLLDLSQAEKTITVVTSWETHKMTTFFTQDHFEWILWISSACNSNSFLSMR